MSDYNISHMYHMSLSVLHSISRMTGGLSTVKAFSTYFSKKKANFFSMYADEDDKPCITTRESGRRQFLKGEYIIRKTTNF